MSLSEMFGLEGKTAVVTGASRGLGRSMALALATAGADVIITGRTQATIDATVADIATRGGTALGVLHDMAVPEEAEAGFKKLVDDHGPIDIVINNVGNRLTTEPVHQQTLSSWRTTIDLNLTSCFLGTRIVAAQMIERAHGGRIINVASMNAQVSNQGIGDRAYEASKAAVVQLTRAAAADLAPHGIAVNAICPGLFMTDANQEWAEKKPEVIDKLVEGIPMGRAGSPEEIGPLAVFLASEASSYVTGAAFYIDGGYTLW
jgi:NAD(P)-dependent dehydrogenase (short-subunit alcohol dehydrogenase family)